MNEHRKRLAKALREVEGYDEANAIEAAALLDKKLGYSSACNALNRLLGMFESIDGVPRYVRSREDAVEHVREI